MIVTSTLNLLAAAFFYVVGRGEAPAAQGEIANEDAGARDAEGPPGWMLRAVALLSGFAVMTLENVLIRYTNVAFGSSTYALSLVLSVFLVAIAAGSADPFEFRPRARTVDGRSGRFGGRGFGGGRFECRGIDCGESGKRRFDLLAIGDQTGFERHGGGAPHAQAIGGEVDQLFAFAGGWDFGRHLGVELSFGGYSPILAMRDPLKGFESYGRWGNQNARDSLTVAYEEITAGA